MSFSIYPVITNEMNLPFYLTGIGVTDPEYDIIRENGLMSHQFLFTLEGCGILEIGGKTFKLKKNSCFYVSTGIPHCYKPENGNWKTAWIVFRGNNLYENMNSLGFGEYMVKDSVNSKKMIDIFDKIYSEANNNYYDKSRVSLLLYQLILTAEEHLVDGEVSVTSNSDIVTKAIKYMNKFYYMDITLEELAENSSVSLQHLCRCFKSAMNMRPIEYLTKKRISEAKSLLMNSSKSVSQIAEEIGYASQTYFGIVFKKYEGITPSDYRKSRGTALL